jgi:hypothetical protein
MIPLKKLKVTQKTINGGESLEVSASKLGTSIVGVRNCNGIITIGGAGYGFIGLNHIEVTTFVANNTITIKNTHTYSIDVLIYEPY